jgi:hypothetical protein
MLELLFGLGLLNDTSVEAEASRKALEAAYIQTGIAANVNHAQGNVSRFARDEAKRTGILPYAAVAGTAVQIYRKRSITAPLSKRSAITIRENSASLTFSF